MRRTVCTGLAARVRRPPPVVFFPAGGPALPPPGMWRRRPETDCARREHLGPERRHLTAARGPGSAHQPGRPRGHSPVGARGAASSRGTCGQAGRARTAQSPRASPPASSPVPSGSQRLPE
ncbi:collagen alpha-2(I) chain-like [Odocoileus virginianus]|uniref:Collagen alpha-2(I) chain-like n=1 Tax=Odocoileus virginianus TaxID=9874 RepID=A0ABM4J1M1_ODOVR